MSIEASAVADRTTPPKYNSRLVERVLLDEAIELHPQRLTVSELCLRIVSDPEDGREVETAADALCNLRRSGLVRYRNDDRIVEPTHAALCAHVLFGA
jgi:hypothetical protein